MAESRHKPQILRAIALMDGDPDAANKILTSVLNEDPDDPAALFATGRLYTQSSRFGIALHMYRKAVQLMPKMHGAWNDLGMCYSSIQRWNDARNAFLEAHKLAGKDAMYMANVAMTHLEESNWKLAMRWAEMALKADPNLSGAHQTIGLASLASGDWERGWFGYSKILGGKFRKVVKVGDEPAWDGKHVDTLFVFGEQGLGDEIMMSSCLEEAARDVGKVVLECDPRLQGLFRRSFPFANVYGTRRVQVADWVDQHKIDAGCGIGELPRFYRPTPASCPGTPYLTADPERRVQWRALLDSLGDKPKIGICWSGGNKWTNASGRKIGLSAFKPLMDAVDADWISLQYKDPQAEIEATGFHVKHWPHATQTQDYDDLAAMVAELDLVIGVNTAAHHLAGGLGTPAIVLVPCRELWIWATPGETPEHMPWYRSVRKFKQRDDEPWLKTIQRLTNDPEYLDRIRSARSSRVSRLHAEHHRNGVGAGGDQAAAPKHVEVVQEPLGRYEQLHHVAVHGAGPGGFPRLGDLHGLRHAPAA